MSIKMFYFTTELKKDYPWKKPTAVVGTECSGGISNTISLNGQRLYLLQQNIFCIHPKFFIMGFKAFLRYQTIKKNKTKQNPLWSISAWHWICFFMWANGIKDMVFDLPLILKCVELADPAVISRRNELTRLVLTTWQLQQYCDVIHWYVQIQRKDQIDSFLWQNSLFYPFVVLWEMGSTSA